MKLFKKLVATTLLIGAPASLYIVSLYGLVSTQICKRERLSERCNLDQDCCAGNVCDSFGFCVRQR